MKKFVAGIVAGLVATMVLSVLMVMKGMMGLMPNLDVILMLSGMMGGAVAMAWAAHFMIGMGYGVVLSFSESIIPGDYMKKGIILGIVGWLMMMIVVMPMTGAGLFGMSMGVMAPVMTLLLHIIFGVVLGLVYGKLRN